MKSTYFLLLFLFARSLYGQSQYLFTLAELKQLASCPNKNCFRRTVTAKGYEFSKVEKSTTNGTPVSMHTYYVLDRSTPQPFYPEHLITYVELGSVGHSVHFLTKNAAFPAQLDADIAQERYVLTGPGDVTQDRKYVQDENGIRWTLNRNKPSFSPSKGVVTYMISLVGLSKPIEPPSEPVASQSTTEKTAYLGGDWDKNYPVRSVGDLLKAERLYAADYERQHGKVGHTFSRCEKVRIQASFTGQYRVLTDERWNKMFDLALQTTGFTELAARRADIFRQEGLFRVGNELIWMPVQQPVISFLRNEVSAVQIVTLYAILVSHHDFSGTSHLSFLVNEFAVANEKQANKQSAEPASSTKKYGNAMTIKSEIAGNIKPVSTSTDPRYSKGNRVPVKKAKSFQLGTVDSTAVMYTDSMMATDSVVEVRSPNIQPDRPKAVNRQSFVGGKTPEELCLALLKALKTNNKSLWMSCMHPGTDAEDDELSAKRFDQYRECLDENGITDWTSVAYSRMTHLARPNGGSKVDLETIRSRVSVEFTYKNQEFVGKIKFASFEKHEGKWLVRCGESGGYTCNVTRSMR